MNLAIRREALELWGSSVTSDDRILVTGASGWFGRTALAMARSSRLPIFATGSHSKIITLDGIEQVIDAQDIEQIAEFGPTVVIDTAFLTREKLGSYGHKRYLVENQKLMRDSLAIAQLPSVRKYVGFSSGATRNLAGRESFSLEENPYASLKMEYEKDMFHLNASSKEINIAIARVWSVSGSYVSKSSVFAFSDLISQASTGLIEIRARNEVVRRYCSIEDVISVAVARPKQGRDPIFDTGGEKIEIGALAEVIRSEINPRAEIVRIRDFGNPIDFYCSDGVQWQSLVETHNLKFESIRGQVRRMSSFLLKNSEQQSI